MSFFFCKIKNTYYFLKVQSWLNSTPLVNIGGKIQTNINYTINY